MEPFEDEGVFWLPGNEGEKRTGRLKFDAVEGATLSLVGGFGNVIEQFSNQARMIRIHGVAGKRYLTLDGCFITNTTHEMPGTTRQTYYVNLIITDHLFGEGEALTFDKCSVAFDQLPAWVRRSGVKVDFQSASPQLTGTSDHIIIEFNQLQDEVVQLGDEQLRLTSTWTLGGDHITETYLNQGTRLELQYPMAQPLENILGDIKHLQDLLTLATAAPTAPLEVTLWRTDITREFRPGEHRPQSMNYYAGQLAERVRLDESQSPGHVLFQFDDIGRLATIAQWLKVARQYHTVVGSLLSIRYAAGLYVENRFNNVISAAESFHRFRFPNYVMPEDEFEVFRRSLIKAGPRDHRNWLGSQLQYSNEPRLRDRLSGMVAHAGAAFAAVCDDGDAWVTVVTESRNRLTHHDEDRAIAFQQGDLYFLTESVFTLVMLCLFRECGMTDDTLTTIGANGSMRFLRGKLAEIISRLYAQVTKSREHPEACGEPEPPTDPGEESQTQ